MVKHTQAIADELFERVWPFCEVGAWRVKKISLTSFKTESVLKSVPAVGLSVCRDISNIRVGKYRRKICEEMGNKKVKNLDTVNSVPTSI